MKINEYPKIKFIALEIAYDNNRINHTCYEEQFLQAVSETVTLYGDNTLKRWENWLASLTKEQCETLGAGEEHEQIILVEDSLRVTGRDISKLCNKIFEIEC